VTVDFAFYNGASAFSSQAAWLVIDSNSGGAGTGYQLQIFQNNTGSGDPNWYAFLNAFGVRKATVIIPPPAFGTFYTAKLERDAGGNVNAYWAGVKIGSTPYGGAGGTAIGVTVGPVGTGAGLTTAIAIGPVTLRGTA
jgi:hypothetical protein